METLHNLFPDAKDLLAISPEDVAPLLLKLLRALVQNGMFYPEAVNDVATGMNNITSQQAGYPYYARQKVATLLAETWAWIKRTGLIALALEINGRNGWRCLHQGAGAESLPAVRLDYAPEVVGACATRERRVADGNCAELQCECQHDLVGRRRKGANPAVIGHQSSEPSIFPAR